MPAKKAIMWIIAHQRWWKRNTIIQENILKKVTGKEDKILVIFGYEHTALLNAMMKYNRNFELVPLSSIL